MNMELIVWRDAGGDADKDLSWADAVDVSDENPIIKSVGWVVKETENNVTIAMDLADDDMTHTRSRIPKGMIVKREVLCPIN